MGVGLLDIVECMMLGVTEHSTSDVVDGKELGGMERRILLG